MLDPDMPDQAMRLHMGEMTDTELEAARAAIRWANASIEQDIEAAEAAFKKAVTAACEYAGMVGIAKDGIAELLEAAAEDVRNGFHLSR